MVRLGITKCSEHSDVASCAMWSPSHELFTAGDDMRILKWKEGQVVTRSTTDTCATSMAWMPAVGKLASESFAVSFSDGTLRLMTSGGREEKKVQAHHGAAIKVLWNSDGTALYSGGEDGELKVWSKTGNLRSTPVKTGCPLYSFSVGPGGEQVCHVKDRRLCVERVGTEKKKGKSWKAHDAAILTVDWNVVNNMIVSGGEDCRYKVWDSFGQALYQSQPYSHVITAVSWAPNGNHFVVGSFQMLRLCDKTGWSWCREECPSNSGSALDVAWTTDGTQLAAATGSGVVLLAQIVDRKLAWDNYEVTLVGPRKIVAHDLSNDAKENLDLDKDRIVDLALGYNQLIVSTTTQLYVYSTSNWNTPFILETPSISSFILMSEKYFLVAAPGDAGITVYGYDGKKISQPKFQGLRAEYLSKKTISLSPDVVAVVDCSEKSLVRLFDAVTGRATQVVTHKAEVTQIGLNQQQSGSAASAHLYRQLIVVDENRDLYLYKVSGGTRAKDGAVPSHKLRAMVDSAVWNDKSEMLVAVADSRLVIWAYPGVVWTDTDLLEETVTTKDGEEFGKLPTIVSFHNSQVYVRRADGPLLTAAVSPFPAPLVAFASIGRWQESLRLCDFVQDDPCWAILATFAVEANNIFIAEVSFARLKLVAKLEYVLYIKGLPSKEAQSAEFALLRRRPEEAEQIFFNAKPPLVYRAIKMNLRLFRWRRALELAVKYRSHIDTVLAYRAKYHEEFETEETDDKFKQLNETVQWTWEEVKAKKDLEKQEEYARNGKSVPVRNKEHGGFYGTEGIDLEELLAAGNDDEDAGTKRRFGEGDEEK